MQKKSYVFEIKNFKKDGKALKFEEKMDLNVRRQDYVLAMYDIRGKQSYIYSGKKVKEIMGASYVIRDCFKDYLTVIEYGENLPEKIMHKAIYSYRDQKDSFKEGFSLDAMQDHFNDGYLGEVIYEGGGNFLVIYKSKDVYREMNKIFSFAVMQKTYSLRVLTTYISDLNFKNYKKDRDRLYEKHRVNERKECSIHPVNALSIVQVSYKNSLPLEKICLIKQNGNYEKTKVSAEAFAKYEKYWSIMSEDLPEKEMLGNKMMDDMITGKGIDSHLAVIYIDGNNMGAQVQKCVGEGKSYEEAVTALRKFSSMIQTHYIEQPIEKINSSLEKMNVKKKENKRKEDFRRFLIHAGDEITFICNAKDAYEVVKAYFKSLRQSFQENPEDFNEMPPTSCAGISIFKSHMPYADAYRIAEECCETGKQVMKQHGISQACFMDFHYCQGAIGTSLENIRKHEENMEISRPWLYVEEDDIRNEKEFFDTLVVDYLVEELHKVGHSNAKILGQAAKEGLNAFLLERNRVVAHSQIKEKSDRPDFSLKDRLNQPLTDEEQRKYIYDIMQIYDLCFLSVHGGEINA